MAASPPSAYPYGQVSKTLIGSGASSYWVFQPQGATAAAPVVIFLHGWMALDPYFYGGWIDHLVRSGNIVVYPVFQASRNDTPEAMEQYALESIRQAVSTLNADSSFRPDWNRLSIVGHSFGGGLSTLVAANAQRYGLPTAKLVVAIAPGWRGGNLPTETLGQIPASTYLLIVDGVNDEFRSNRQGAAIYAATPQIPTDRKEIIVLGAGSNAQVNHSSPLAPLESYRNSNLSSGQVLRQRIATSLFNLAARQQPGTIDFIDSNGYWRILDAANQAIANGEPVLPTVSQRFGQSSGGGTPDNPRQLTVVP